MGEMGEFSIPVRAFLKAYRWRRIDPTPWTPLKKPLAACRLGLVTSAGFLAPGAARFDEKIRGGDYHYREILDDVDMSALIEDHKSDSFDHNGVREDANLALPIERVRELAAAGRIGSVNHRHLSFMGSLTSTGALVKETAPEAAEMFVSDGVDVALLVPV